MALDKNLKNLQALLAVMETDHLTKQDFIQHFKLVVDMINKLKADIAKAIADFDQIYKLAASKTKSDHGGNLKDLKLRMEKELNGLRTEFDSLARKVIQKLMEVKDGKDADEERVINEVLNRIPEHEDTILDTPQEIRDKLESIKEEKEKLAIEAVRNLRKELDELKARPLGGKVGGGFSKMALEGHFIDDETPSGSVNGVNTDFVLGNSINPQSSLKVFVNGQRMRLTTDYTFNVRTITFLTAPPTGSIILVDYRT